MLNIFGRNPHGLVGLIGRGAVLLVKLMDDLTTRVWGWRDGTEPPPVFANLNAEFGALRDAR